MEAVAERDDPRGLNRVDDLGQAIERGARVVGRKQHAERGEGRALLQMQVGDEQRALVFPVERARRQRPHRVAGDDEMRAERRCRLRHEFMIGA